MISTAEPPLSNQLLIDHLGSQDDKGLLRFMTCGSVDDGKSTLIGRLLYDANLIYEEHLANAVEDMRRLGVAGDTIDFALLIDGLQAEREQGITIDVAYRSFTTAKRRFIVADTPGHEQYMRNMASGASNSDLAIILIDARKGILPQTRRHTFVASLLGIRHLIIAVNKMDLVEWDHRIFNCIVSDFLSFASRFDFSSLQAIPMCARSGDNIFIPSPIMPWYQGPTLIEHLETIDVSSELESKPFRFQVQWVNRPNSDFRGFSGTVASGTVRVGEKLVVAGSGRGTKVKSIVTYDGDLSVAVAGQAVTLTLEDEIDVSRGDVLCPSAERVEVTDRFQARLIWMNEEPLVPGRRLLIKLGTRTAACSVTDICCKIDVNTFTELAASSLQLNEMAVVHLKVREPLACESYNINRAMGGFIVIDPVANLTLGAGIIEHGLWHHNHVHPQALTVSKETRATIKGQKPMVVWFTGLSGAGKSTIANAVEKKLVALGKHTYLLDGDNIRQGLSSDLGFTDSDRIENIRRVAEVSRLLVDAGIIALVSFISPFRSERQLARELLAEDEFAEIYVATPLSVAEARDTKGLYARARRGEIKNFTGIDSPYEVPESPELSLDTTTHSAEQLANVVVELILERCH
ncbi:sulfate adenylyltransferase subunit CysN [Rhizobium lemnae]|uniref:Multifunctional fusion protein n=1 Tax=Rhizobium lemnae TaxID=1214924 RepID=A0ABV8E559_9HYPH|nr:sulfate adenylyltransferase subunit CysN [Rhizobium lemnae]MCJ8510356.1 sulfate adenylyltransferase subunit CysN [Rhizobium lemnae]